MDSKFKTALESHIAGCQKLIDAAGTVYPEALVYKNNRKYIKVIVTTDGKYRNAFSFIDKATGNILKAASWNAPAKHARGNIFDDHNGLKHMSWTGPCYLR